MGGRIKVFAIIGGKGASHLCLRKASVPSAPISVAIVPKTTSHTAAPVSRFVSRHPTASPGTAAGINAGNTVSASESLSCTTAVPESPNE